MNVEPKTVGELIHTIQDFSQENTFMKEEGWDQQFVDMLTPPAPPQWLKWLTGKKKPEEAPAVTEAKQTGHAMIPGGVDAQLLEKLARRKAKIEAQTK